MATPSGGPATGLPCTRSVPVLSSVRPAMQRSSVVLPQPLGPTMQRISSRLTVKRQLPERHHRAVEEQLATRCRRR